MKKSNMQKGEVYFVETVNVHPPENDRSKAISGVRKQKLRDACDERNFASELVPGINLVFIF
jgi:hypothetical protein